MGARWAGLLALAACSSGSPAPEPQPSMATASPALDAAAPVVAVADAAPPQPKAACLPQEWYGDLALVGGRARLCSAEACLWLDRDGAAALGEVPVEPDESASPRAEILYPEGEESEEAGAASGVEVCLAEGRCRTITPTPPEAIRQIALDAAGGRVAILLQADPLDGGTVEVYDASTGKRLARASMGWDDHHGVSYAIAWLGSLLLWIEYPGATEAAYGYLYKVKGKKLASVEGIGNRVYTYAQAGKYLLFAGDSLSVDLHDARTGKRKGAIDVSGLLREGEEWEENSSLPLAAAGDEAVVAAVAATFARLAFVKVPDGKPVIVEIPRCSV